MYQFIILIHVFVAVFIIALVLVQQGKGATVGAAFGSGASQTMFGSRGAGSFLFKITMGLITLFFVTSLLLNYLTTSAYKTNKVIQLPIKQQPANVESQNGVGKIPQRSDTKPILPADIPAR